MTIELDLSRLDRVSEVLGTSIPDIVAGILDSLTESLSGLQTHLEQGELELAAKAAHACRNDALLVGAQPLLRTLNELEQAARDGRSQDAHAAHALLDGIWPETRRALAEIAERPS